MNFAYPSLLYLLLLIPAFVGLYIWARLARKRKLRHFGNISTLSALMPDASRYTGPIKLIVSLIALAAIVIALARPRWGGDGNGEETTRSGIEIMICLDVSHSMNASSNDDARGVSRLNRAKLLLGKLIDKLSNDRVGLIVFAGSAYTQLPITNDFSIARMYLNEVNTNMVTTQGTDIGMALRMAINSFSPDDKFNKAIILITDSEDHEQGAIEAAKQASEAGIQVDVIGIGSIKPTPIPLNSARTEFLRDHNGDIVMTTLNDETARLIAQAGKGVYINGSSNDAVDKLVEQVDNIEKTDFATKQYSASAEQFPWFAWIALFAIVIEILILDRKNGWLKRINFFSQK